VQALWQEWRSAWHQQLALAALEVERAARSLVAMVAFGVAGGVLAASAWLGLLAVAALWLIDSGLPITLALLAVVFGNLAGSLALVLAVQRRGRHLALPATIASLSRPRP
jgi:Putative Actinobacterial Holin-X, holin superfamily III